MNVMTSTFLYGSMYDIHIFIVNESLSVQCFFWRSIRVAKLMSEHWIARLNKKTLNMVAPLDKINIIAHLNHCVGQCFRQFGT